MAFGLRRAKILGYVSVQLVSKVSNLCDPDPPTSQTDRQTDVMQSQYRTLHYSASRGKKSQCATYNAQNPLDKFLRNFLVDGKVANLSRTC